MPQCDYSGVIASHMTRTKPRGAARSRLCQLTINMKRRFVRGQGAQCGRVRGQRVSHSCCEPLPSAQKSNLVHEAIKIYW
jgi:hypothetical protein